MFSDLKVDLILILCFWMPAFAVWRSAGRARLCRKSDSESPQKWIILIPILSFSGGVFLSLAIVSGARIFLSGSLLTASYILACSVFLTVMIDLASDYRYPAIRSKKETKKKIFSSSLMVFIGMAAFLFVVYLKSMPGVKRDACNMTNPFRGKWRVITGGRFKFMNYHHNNPDVQNYAVDFVKDGPEDASRGQKIFSPVTGKVLKAVGNRKEGEYDPPEGNIVILETDDGILVWLCHLQEGSVKVRDGGMVKAGEEIAACGASGGADVPHLHLHAEHNGKAVPMLLGKRHTFPIRGDIISPESSFSFEAGK